MENNNYNSNKKEEQKIERKKWTDGCTERVNRLRDQYWQFTPSLDVERALSYTKTYKESEADEVIIKRSKAFLNYFKEKNIVINPEELIVGVYGKSPRAALLCPEVCWLWTRDELDTMDTRGQDPYAITEEDKKALKEVIFPFWEGRSVEEYYWANVTEELKDVTYQTNVIYGEAKSTGGGCEFAPDFGGLLIKNGFKGIEKMVKAKLASIDLADVDQYEQRLFYNAMLMMVETAKVIGQRHADEARKQAVEEKNETRKAELLNIADICEKVPYNPPETFHEALQFVWFTQLMTWTEENEVGISIERLDQYCYPFYKKDVEAGIITPLEAQELIECLWIKMAEILYCANLDAATYNSGYQPFHGVTLGGIDENGEDATNELSYMGIQATMNLRMHAPSVHVRISKKTSDDFLLKVVDLIAMGTGQPAVFFDENLMEQLRVAGVEEGDLYNYVTPGCVEAQIPGKTSQWNEGCRFAYSTAVEWALFNGVSPMLGRRLGPETGDARHFKTYEEFEQAVKKHIDFLIDVSCRNTQIIEKGHMKLLPKPMKSITYQSCIDRGSDTMQGGAYYPAGPGLELTGVADMADSLMAIKKLVFEEKKITMEKLLEALKANFEGYESIRQMLINDAPKYGNDIDEVDEIAANLISYSNQVVKNYKSPTGSNYMICLVPVTANIPHGEATWALPSGRKAKEPLADGISPFNGYDKNGPTAIIKSICKLNHAECGGGTLLNMKFSPDLLKTKEDRIRFADMLRTEAALGGNHVQFNVVSVDTLKDAQIHPEDHQDLLVRVAAYSAYFVDLRKDAQDNIIGRTEISNW
jgi:formate C-acetyltransferase